jgi:hypothetical protein
MVPPGTDQGFLQVMLGPGALYTSVLQRRVRCSVELVQGAVMIRPDPRTGGDVAATRAEVEALIKATHSERAVLLREYLAQGSQVSTDDDERTTVKMPPSQLSSVMVHKRVLLEETGCTNLEVTPELNLCFCGSASSRAKATTLLKRVCYHSQWGSSVPKVLAVLRTEPKTGCVVRLSAMCAALPPSEQKLTAQRDSFRIGTDKASCDVVVEDAVLSRKHVAISFSASTGTLYVIDTSTNGTFLNRKPLPSPKKTKAGKGRVVIVHGDELLLKPPTADLGEFGYILNIQFT